MSNLPTREEEWKLVQSAYSDMMYQEAAERGYDHQAAQEAKTNFYIKKGAYEKRHKTLWSENDIMSPGGYTAKEAAEVIKDSREFINKIGHNNPPEEIDENAELIERQKEVIGVADKLIEAKARIPEKCDDEEIAGKLTNTIALITKTTKRLDAARKTEKEPALEEGRRIDRLFNGYINSLEIVKRQANGVLTRYLTSKAEKERKDREEAAAVLRREAAAQEEAARQLEDAGREEEAEETYLAADKISDHAEHLVSSAMKPVASVAVSRTSAGTASLRTVTVGIIEDREKLDLEKLRPYIKLDALQSALNQYVANGGRQIAGARIEEQSSATIRGRR